MIRILLLAAGLLLMLGQSFVFTLPAGMQFGFFIAGIVLLGIPHGAADFLVARQQSMHRQQSFSPVQFLSGYILRLVVFGALIWLFPLPGMLLFIIFAAYHFGETDLHGFRTDTWAGKIFVSAYGLVILSVIILHHFEEVLPLLQQFDAGNMYGGLLKWVDDYRYILLTGSGFFFFAATFYYFASVKHQYPKADFLVQLGLLLIILYHLTLVTGFTFYFIIWHSVLSMRSITGYLSSGGRLKGRFIFRQICLYSGLAMGGMAVFGLAGMMFANTSALMMYVFLGLAVLTAPHMQIMHRMYEHLRKPAVPVTGGIRSGVEA